METKVSMDSQENTIEMQPAEMTVKHIVRLEEVEGKSCLSGPLTTLVEVIDQQHPHFLSETLAFPHLDRGIKTLNIPSAHAGGGLVEVGTEEQGLPQTLQQNIQSEHAYPQVDRLDREEGELNNLQVLRQTQEHILQNYPDMVAILMEGVDKRIFLNVFPKYPDRFLLDQSGLRLNISTSPESAALLLELFTNNRELVRRVEVVDIHHELCLIVEDMISERYQCCTGLPGQVGEDQIKMTDLPHLLIEKYGGCMVLRSRDCRFIVDNETNSQDAGTESRNHCPDCRIFSSTILTRTSEQRKTDFFNFVEPDNEEYDRLLKKKRGRPKGSRNRIKTEDEVIQTKEDLVENVQQFDKMLDQIGEIQDDLKVEGELVQQTVIARSIVGMEDEKNPSKSVIEEGTLMTEFLGENHQENEDENLNYEPLATTFPKRGSRKKIISKKLLEMKAQDSVIIQPKRQHKIILPIECPETGCEMSFESEAVFKEHLQNHVGSMVCREEGCIKRFRDREELVTHEKRHKGEKPFSCSECKKTYSTRQDLRLHFRKHTGEKPFPCDMCSKEFARKAALRIHKISVHSDLKSYLCADCGAAFKANSALIDHKKRVHLQIKPHHCEFCGKEFFSKKDYGEHTRTHTGEKPYQCQLCGKCFGRGYHLKRHVDGVHRNPGGLLIGSDGLPLPSNSYQDAVPQTQDQQTIETPLSPSHLAPNLTIDSLANIPRKGTVKKIKVQPPKMLFTSLSQQEQRRNHPSKYKDVKPSIEVAPDVKPFLSNLVPSQNTRIGAPLDLAQKQRIIIPGTEELGQSQKQGNLTSRTEDTKDLGPEEVERTRRNIDSDAKEQEDKAENFRHNSNDRSHLPLNSLPHKLLPSGNQEIGDIQTNRKLEKTPGDPSQTYRAYPGAPTSFLVGNYYKTEDNSPVYMEQSQNQKVYKLQ